jgi:uncharacterized protein (TIGR02246 family)
MKPVAKKRAKSAPRKRIRTARKSAKTSHVAVIIRQMGNDWARHWNAGILDKVVAAYAPDAVYLAPHHEAIHGLDAIREYLRGPLSHGVSDLAFDVTYIKQDGNVAWDVGTYRMNVPLNGGTKKEDRGKYLTVWNWGDAKWRIAADAWSSDLPASADPGEQLG